MGIENMLMLHGMTMDDIELVEFPYPDDWYDKPEMLQVTMNNPSELWMRRDHKHDYAFRPLEKALLAGTVDAIYTQSKVFQHIQEATGQLAMIEDLSRYPDWRIQVANTPAVITCTDVMANEHPELVIAYMKAMIKVGRWANEHKRAAGGDPQPPDVLPRRRGHVPGHQGRGHGAEPERAELADHQDRQGLHVQPRLHQERLRRGHLGAARSSSRRRSRKCSRRSGRAGAGASSPRGAGSRWRASGSGSGATLRTAGGDGPPAPGPARSVPSRPPSAVLPDRGTTLATIPRSPQARQTSLGLYVSAKEAYDMWQADPGLKILDVRTPEEYVFVGHAPMATNIPFALQTYEWDPEKNALRWEMNPDFVAEVGAWAAPDDTILASCRSGGRSAMAINALARLPASRTSTTSSTAWRGARSRIRTASSTGCG